jgi:hypothetical protein
VAQPCCVWGIPGTPVAGVHAHAVGGGEGRRGSAIYHVVRETHGTGKPVTLEHVALETGKPLDLEVYDMAGEHMYCRSGV